MNLLTSIAIGILFGAGVHLILQRDLSRAALGSILITDAAVLFILSAGFGGKTEAIAPWASAREVSDPLAQALGLTGIVVGFGTTALLLRIVIAAARSHHRSGPGGQWRGHLDRSVPPEAPRPPAAGRPGRDAAPKRPPGQEV